MFRKKEKIKRRLDLELRAPKKRKSFFEKKEEASGSPIILRAVFRILFSLFAALVFYVLFFSPFLEVKEIRLEGVSELSYNDVYRKISSYLEGKYFNFVPKNNFILIFPDRIKKDLQNDFKKIGEIEVRKVFPDEIAVKIVERKALLVWCSGKCHIIDENGYAYTEADFESEEIKQNHLVNITDMSAKPVSMGQKVLSEDYINFAISLKEKLENEVEIKIKNEYQTQSKLAEEIRVMSEDGWGIYFSTAIPLEDNLQALKTFLEKEMAGKDRSKLEYVDLRAENKVYYKFKDEEQTDVNTQTSPENSQTSAETKKNDKKKKN